MHSPLKRYLLACSSALAFSIGIPTGAYADIAINDTGTTTEGGVIAGAITYSADGTLVLSSATGGSTITTVTTAPSGIGTLTLTNTSGTNTFGAIGSADLTLKALNLQGSGGTTALTGDMVVLDTTIAAGAILTSAGNITSDITFTGAGTITLSGDDVNLLGDINTTGGGSGGYGTINVTGSGVGFSDSTVGTSSSDRLTAMNLNNTGTTTVYGTIFAATVSMLQDGTLTLSMATGGSDITSLDITTDDTGTLILANTSGTNTFGAIGDATHALNTMTFSADSTLALTELTGGSKISTVSITTSDTGTITVANTSGTNTFGTIGDATHLLKNFSIGGAGGTSSVTTLYATDVTFAANGTLTLTGSGSAITAIDVGTTGDGTLTLTHAAGTNTIGSIGDATHVLGALNANGASGTTAVTGNAFVGTLTFGADATVSIGGTGSTLTAVDISTNNTGTLTLTNASGTNTIGSIGDATHAIKRLNVTGTEGSTTVTGDLYATDIVIGSGATLNAGGGLAGDVTFTSSTGTLNITDNDQTFAGSVISTGGGSSGYGILRISGTGTTLSGTLVGTSSVDKLASLDIHNTGTTTLSGTLYVNDLDFTSDGTLVLSKATGGSNITDVNMTLTNTGSITVSNTSGTNTFGSVGTVDHALKTFTINGAGGTTLVTNGLSAFTVDFDANATLTLSGSGGSILTLTTATDDTGTVTMTHTSGTNTFGTIGDATHRIHTLLISGAGGTTSITNEIYSDSIYFADNGTLDFAKTSGGLSIAAISATSDDVGILTSSNVSGTNTFGTIGSAANSLHAFNVTGGGGTTATTGDVYATTSTVSSGATLSTQGDIYGDIQLLSGGTWSVGADDVGVSGNIVNNGTVDLNTHDLAVAGAVSGSGTIALGTSTLTVTGNVSGASSVITTTLGLTDSGFISNTDNTTNATFTTALTVVPTIENGVLITGGTKVLIIDGDSDNAAVDLTGVLTTYASGRFTWTAMTGQTGTDLYGRTIGAEDLIIVAAAEDIQDTYPGVHNIQATALDNLANYGGSNAGVQAIQTGVLQLTTAAELNRAGAQLAADANGARHVATIDTVNGALDTLLTRNFTLRTASIARRGVASGEAARTSGVWAQGFGSWITADERRGISGYDSFVRGAAFGADTRVGKKKRLGAMFAYADTDVDQNGDLTGSSLKVTSYIGTLYGTYTGRRWYLDGNLTFGYHDYESSRLVSIGGAPTQIAKGSFGGMQYGVNAEFGYPLMIGRTIMTPYASAAFNYLLQDKYVETGAPGANLSVDSVSLPSFRTGLGSKLSRTVGSTQNWVFTSNGHAAWLHEFFADAPTVTTSFAGGSSFKTPGVKLAKEAAQVGIGMDMKSRGGTALSAKYDFELRSKYMSNSMMLQIRQKF